MSLLMSEINLYPNTLANFWFQDEMESLPHNLEWLHLYAMALPLDPDGAN